jgi:hypothetical protein
MLAHFLVAYTCSAEVNENLFDSAKLASNACEALSPIFIFIIILSNGKNRKLALLQFFRKIANRYRKWRISREHKKRRARESKSRVSFYEELMSPNRDTVAIELSNMPSFDGYLSQMKDKNRAYLLSSLLGCLAIHHL